MSTLNSVVRRALFCLYVTLFVQSSVSSADFKRSERDAITTPSVRLTPDSNGNFIYFKYWDNSTVQPYVDSINKFLNAYDETKPNQTEGRQHCDFHDLPQENNTCIFNTSSLNICSQQGDFGYYNGAPCVYLTLRQVLDWIPFPLDGSDIRHSEYDAFRRMPNHLVYSIAKNEFQNLSEEYIWLTCDGDTAADKEMMGPISYYPSKGFPAYYFPFKNIDGYQSPVVAVHFERPAQRVAITVVCKAWAKNIQLDEKRGLGFVKFVLLID